jgi:hypothetical protein
MSCDRFRVFWNWYRSITGEAGGEEDLYRVVQIKSRQEPS